MWKNINLTYFVVCVVVFLRPKMCISDTLTLKIPDLKDAEAVQKFFLEEIQLGEELLSQGQPHVCSLTHGTCKLMCTMHIRESCTLL